MKLKAQIIKEFGSSTSFVLTEIEKPKAIPGYVVIKVKATSLNPIDIKVRSGAVPAAAPELPAVLHGDVAGIVEEIGEGVTEFQIGDAVFGCAGGFRGTGGALAEYMLADVRLLAPKPKNISMEQAAALPLVSITAWEALFEKGNLKSDDSILIHAATGGVGHVAIQLAKWAGAKVYTTVSSSKKSELATKLGADFVINYREQTVEQYVKEYTDGQGFSVVFDTVGGENIDKSFQAASINGKVLVIAARSTHDLSPMHAKALSLHVVFMLLKIIHEKNRNEHGVLLKKIASLVEAGHLVPLLDQQVFTFDEVRSAHDYYESGKTIGKLVLVNTW